jgi:hypothetical protein
MVESMSDFPFRKLRDYIYMALEVVMYVEAQDVFKFFYSVNKETRSFIERNFIKIENGFINNGLVTYQVDETFGLFD